MRFLIFLVAFIFNIGCSEENYYINEVLFIQNDYWEKIKRIETDLRYLDSISLQINNVKGFFKGDKVPLIDIHYNPINKKHVFVLNARASNFILSSINRGKTIVLNYRYTFTNLIPKTNERNFYSYDNFKILTKGPNNIINVENDDCFNYLSHVKQIYLTFINSAFIILENFESVLEDDFAYQPPKFKLRYFKSLYSCIKCYKKFMIFLNFINLEEDTKTIFFGKKPENNYNNEFKASNLENYLKKRFFDDYFENKNRGLNFNKLIIWILTVFKGCKIELVDRILSNIIMLPFKGDFTIDFYFERFYLLIKEVIDEAIQKIDPDSQDCEQNCYNLVESFIKNALKLSKEIVGKSWELLRAIDFFSHILDKEIKNVNDYIKIDRIMCDFYNMLCCVSGIRDNLEDSQLAFIDPMLVDSHEFRVTKGIEITLESPFKLKEITGYNSEETVFLLERNIDYFVKDLKNGFSARFSLEKLRKRGVQFIEIITTDTKFYKKFKFHLDQLKML